MQTPTPLDMVASTGMLLLENLVCTLWRIQPAPILAFLVFIYPGNCWVCLSTPKLVLRLRFVHEAALFFNEMCNCLNGYFLRSIPAGRKKTQKGFGPNLPIGNNFNFWPRDSVLQSEILTPELPICCLEIKPESYLNRNIKQRCSIPLPAVPCREIMPSTADSCPESGTARRLLLTSE